MSGSRPLQQPHHHVSGVKSAATASQEHITPLGRPRSPQVCSNHFRHLRLTEPLREQPQSQKRLPHPPPPKNPLVGPRLLGVAAVCWRWGLSRGHAVRLPVAIRHLRRAQAGRGPVRPWFMDPYTRTYRDTIVSLFVSRCCLAG